MTTETRQRIRAYKRMLPELRERVIAVALLFAMSASMLGTASYAWLTLSRAPEVSNVNTTIAANGNLEIALSDKDGLQPEESAVGDSSVREGQSTTAANITWGNLINLSDLSYGLESLVLRPAQLNELSLLDEPLNGAVYSTDGRIEKLDSNFRYATWNPPEGVIPGFFAVPENNEDVYGVRAISSTEIKSMGGDITFLNMVNDANSANLAAKSAYESLTKKSNYMTSLATLMGSYMTAKMNASNEKLKNPEIDISHVINLYNMYSEFAEAIDKEIVAMAATVDLYRFLEQGKGYIPCTPEEILNKTYSQYTTTPIQFTNLDVFLNNRKTVLSDTAKLKNLTESGVGTITWTDSGINSIVNNLVNVGTCTVDGKTIDAIIAGGIMNATGYLSGTHTAKITNGILYNFEMRTGARLQVNKMKISVTVERYGAAIPGSVTANISTSADRCFYDEDLDYAKNQNTGNYMDVQTVAQDTYGLAIDIWVRTNAANSYLTLEGNVLTEEETVEVTGWSSIAEEEVPLYTYTETVMDEASGESVSIDHDIYMYNDEWYDYKTHSKTTVPAGVTPTRKLETRDKVIGFEGENRVWDDNTLISTDATTQGSGSCYIYYADTPEDQARSLKLLDAFNVAFIDERGKLLTTAKMDVSRFYADNGRVIVPLVLPIDSIDLGEDIEGNTIRAITPLEKNVPMRITALVYLDGTELTNEEVLSAADIHGQLNIQFGSSQKLAAVKDEKLQDEIRIVTASVSRNSFDYGTDDNLTTTVSVHVDGNQPKKMTAFFLRQINSTQGSREGKMEFVFDESSNTWLANYTFTAPGNYVLRTVQLDGMEYVLSADATPRVTVEGFTVETLTCDQAVNKHISVMTADGSYPVTLRLKFASDDSTKLPSKVQGRFIMDGDGKAVNIDFSMDTKTQEWVGEAKFLSSGSYTLQYLVLDGEYTELPETLYHTADIKLGMRVEVYTTSPYTFTYSEKAGEMADNEKKLAMRVKILDNSGKELQGLSDAKLYYAMTGSVRQMDADLTWNGNIGYYVGEMLTTSAGIFKFSYVSLQTGDTITSATTYPTFTIMPSEPPAYIRHTTMPTQYAVNGKATMNVILSNAETADAKALIVDVNNKSDEGEWIKGARSGAPDGTLFDFELPEEYQRDGNFQITELKIWNIVNLDQYGNTTILGENNAMRLTAEDLVNSSGTPDTIVTKVLKTTTVSFAEDYDTQEYRGNAFMVPYTLKMDDPVQLKFTNFEGTAFDSRMVSNVKMTVSYDPATFGYNTQQYGGYTIAEGDRDKVAYTFDVALAADSEGLYAVQQESAVAQLLCAGEYEVTALTYTVAGQTTTVTRPTDEEVAAGTEKANSVQWDYAPSYHVYTGMPTVQITAISPKGTYAVDNTAEQSLTDSSTGSGCDAKYTINSSHKSRETPSLLPDGLNATVYFQCFHEGYEGDAGAEKYHYYYFGDKKQYGVPEVTIKLNNLGNFETATLNFNDSSHIYSNVTYTGSGLAANGTWETTGSGATFSWTQNNAVSTKYIGYSWTRKSRLDDKINAAGRKVPAGSITAETLTVIAEGNTYTFVIPKITINNPY